MSNNALKHNIYKQADSKIDKIGLNLIQEAEIGKNNQSIKNLNFDVFINNMIQDEVQASESKVDLN